MEERVPASAGSFNIQPETYVIQIPKDRIFNVPPSEHANIIERHLNEKKSNKGSGNGCCSPRCFSCMFGALFIIGVIIGISVAILHALIQPKLPIISIKTLNVKNYDPKSTKLAEFVVTLVARNDGKMSMSPDGNGDATLMYKNVEIGKGRFPGLRVGSGQSKTVSLRLKGMGKGKLPIAAKASMADKKGKNPISVWVMMRIPVVMRAPGVKSQSKEMDVNCKLRVRSLGSNKGVTSQKCQAKFIT